MLRNAITSSEGSNIKHFSFEYLKRRDESADWFFKEIPKPTARAYAYERLHNA